MLLYIVIFTIKLVLSISSLIVHERARNIEHYNIIVLLNVKTKKMLEFLLCITENVRNNKTKITKRKKKVKLYSSK